MVINGSVKLSKGVFFGSNATCYPNLHIGKSVTIGIGSAVFNNVKDGKTVIGVPAKAIF